MLPARSVMKKNVLILLFSGSVLAAGAQTQAASTAGTTAGKTAGKTAVTRNTGVELSTRSHQKRRIDSMAVHLLDSMSATIGSMRSCSVKINVVYDIRSHNLGLIKHSDEEQLYLQGPDKLHIKAEGDKGGREFYYNGKMLCYYSADRNQYSEVPAPADIMAMIDSSHTRYGIDFPAADFFYPGFVDDIIGESSLLVYLGKTRIGDKECFHIAGLASDKAFQFWISADEKYLPLKMVLVYTSKNMNPQYEANLTDWQVNPVLDQKLFKFSPPAGAKKIRFLARNQTSPAKAAHPAPVSAGGTDHTK